MIKKYNVELEGQRNFYESYLRLVDNTLSIDEVFADNTDGTLRGNLLEFKLNMVNAIEQGIILDSTKDRLTKLENDKKELEIVILQEQIKKPFLTKEQIRFGIEKFKKLDISTKDGKQRLIDGFINSIYLYDDKIMFTFNYKDGTKTVVFNELETAECSDIKCFGAPKKEHLRCKCSFFRRTGRKCRRGRY